MLLAPYLLNDLVATKLSLLAENPSWSLEHSKRHPTCRKKWSATVTPLFFERCSRGKILHDLLWTRLTAIKVPSVCTMVQEMYPFCSCTVRVKRRQSLRRIMRPWLIHQVHQWFNKTWARSLESSTNKRCDGGVPFAQSHWNGFTPTLGKYSFRNKWRQRVNAQIQMPCQRRSWC